MPATQAPHYRHVLRQRIIDALQGMSLTGDRVFESITKIISGDKVKGKLPCAVVWVSTETIENEGKGGRDRKPVLGRKATVLVSAVAVEVVDVETILAEAEQRLADPELEMWMRPTRVDFADNLEAERRFVTGQIAYELAYQTHGDPTKPAR